MNIARSRISFLAGIAAVWAARAASASPAARRAAKSGRTVRVRIKDLAFAPKVLHVAAGTTVTWTNEDDVVHTVTSGVAGDDGRWVTSPGLAPGASFSHTFASAGTYPYFCKPHFYNEAMHATVVVT